MASSDGNCNVPVDGADSPSSIAVMGPDEDDIRRCSIGSASSLMAENNNVGVGQTHMMQHQLSVPGTAPGQQLGRQLSIRRVSDISHINELRRCVHT